MKFKSISMRLIYKFLSLVFLLSIIINCNIEVNAVVITKTFEININPSNISKEEVVKLIKTQTKKSNYYFDTLSYELVNLDNDSDLEIAAKVIGGVHIGNFYIFDKNRYGKYSLAAEREWKVEIWDFLNYYIIDGIKVYKMTTRTGGSGLDELTAHLWYLKEGKFVEAWEGTLKERTFFNGNCYLNIGSYQFNSDDNRLYAWLSNYSIKLETDILIEEPTTTVSVYKFDGNKYILQTKNKCGYTK